MDYEAMRTASYVITTVGTILVAIGGYGSYYFGKKVEAEQAKKEKKVQEEFREGQSKLLAGQEEIRSLLKKKESDLSERLAKDYPLGYALIYTDGKLFIFEDRKVKVSIDWSKTEILGLNEKTINLRLPDWIDTVQQVQVGQTQLVLSRQEGFKGRVFSTKNLRLVGEVIENRPSSVIVAIGFSPKDE